MNVSISFLIICVVIVVVIASIVSWLFVYKKRAQLHKSVAI